MQLIGEWTLPKIIAWGRQSFMQYRQLEEPYVAQAAGKDLTQRKQLYVLLWRDMTSFLSGRGVSANIDSPAVNGRGAWWGELVHQDN